MEYRQIIRRLYKWVFFKKHHKLFFHNCYPINWFESDFISITGSDFIHEFEVKRTAADFRNDFTKEVKHSWLGGKRDIVKLDERHKRGLLNVEKNDDDTVKIQYEYDLSKFEGPNYFWYVCPVGVIKIEDIPSYAGLIEVNDKNLVMNIVKEAPRLHKNKITIERKQQLWMGIMFKYWKAYYKEK